MTQLFKVKQIIHKHKDKSFNVNEIKKYKLKAQPGCMNSLLTVPTEEVAHWQYKTVLIIFPLNLQTIVITLDVVKWRGR